MRGLMFFVFFYPNQLRPTRTGQRNKLSNKSRSNREECFSYTDKIKSFTIINAYKVEGPERKYIGRPNYVKQLLRQVLCISNRMCQPSIMST